MYYGELHYAIKSFVRLLVGTNSTALETYYGTSPRTSKDTEVMRIGVLLSIDIRSDPIDMAD